MPIKKLRNGPTIDVDLQIVRWRERLRKEGIAIGKGMIKAKEKRTYNKLVRSMDTDEKLKKKKWFE